jgi:hypothetical protein
MELTPPTHMFTLLFGYILHLGLVNKRIGSLDVSVGTATRLQAGGSTPGIGKRFFLLHNVQTGSDAHPAAHTMGTRGSFPGGKAALA